MRLLLGLVAGLLGAMAPQSAAADDAEVHTFHCLDGCPAGAPASNDLVVREIYTLSSNDETKFADWVAYRVAPETIGPTDDRNWAADPWLAPEETLEPADYDGAPRALRIDRGHQAPLASFTGTPFGASTNFLSNITPQGLALNRGRWLALEDAERELVRATGSALFVLTGPLYERDMSALPNADEAHRLPSGYWKVVATADGRLAAFIMDQELPRDSRFCESRATLAEVEARSRLRLFPRRAERGFTPLDTQLGC